MPRESFVPINLFLYLIEFEAGERRKIPSMKGRWMVGRVARFGIILVLWHEGHCDGTQLKCNIMYNRPAAPRNVRVELTYFLLGGRPTEEDIYFESVK